VKHCMLMLAILLLVQVPLPANEQTDRRLAELLQPSVSFSMLPGQPKAFAEPKALLPRLAVPRFEGQPLRPQFAAGKSARPHDPAEPAPLEIVVATPIIPAAVVMLPDGPVAAVPVVDPTVPPTMPNLARPTTDRAPLTDATLEASLAAVLRTAIPLRRLTVPFVPMNLPDPFELQDVILVQRPLDEDFQPMPVPPRILVRPIEPADKK
jgi:hypothetical protein